MATTFATLPNRTRSAFWMAQQSVCVVIEPGQSSVIPAQQGCGASGRWAAAARHNADGAIANTNTNAPTSGDLCVE